MQRLRQFRDYLVENSSMKIADIVCHTEDGELIPVEQETETGIHLFDEKYEAVVYIDDVTEKEYGYIKLLAYDWFRENQLNEEESLRFSSEEIDDVTSLVLIDLTLIETTHLVADPDGNVERDGSRYSLGDAPIPMGI